MGSTKPFTLLVKGKLECVDSLNSSYVILFNPHHDYLGTQAKCNYYHSFTSDKTKAWRYSVICPRLHPGTGKTLGSSNWKFHHLFNIIYYTYLITQELTSTIF